jgi:transketolase
MKIRSLFVFTHDSIGLGEDGPTHQPVEHLTMLRAIPDLTDFRPADANETAACWRLAIERTGPSFFALSRQDLPIIDPAKVDVLAGVSKGAYVVEDADKPQVVLIATGSEVSASIEAAKLLAGEGIQARVVSMPSVKIFDEQTAEYKASVLLTGVPRIAIEAGATIGWWKYVGLDGDVVGIDRFGASAPGPIVLKKLGFGADSIAARAKKLVK